MPAISKKARANDIHDIERRLELQIHYHLLDMEENPTMFAAKDRLSAIQYIGMYLNRKFGWGDPETGDVGASVRKYAGAFRTPPHVGGGGAKSARSGSGRVAGGIALVDAEPESEESDTAA